MKPIDLKLLAVFDALYEHRSVTRAAQRLNLTQSAVSHALRRLRDAAADPLFVRSGGALQPTSRAEEMAPSIREGLSKLYGAMAPRKFEAATASRTFTLAAGSYFCALLIPRLVARTRDVAPSVVLRVVPVGPDLLTDLDEGNVDLALGAFSSVPQRLRMDLLFREELVWIASGASSTKISLSLEEIARNPHLVIATRRPFEPIRTFFAEGALEALVDPAHDQKPARTASHAAMIVYDALTAAAVVAQTDMVALVPRRLALIAASRFGLRILESEREEAGIDLAMVTHSRTASDPGLAFLRSLVAEVSLSGNE